MAEDVPEQIADLVERARKLVVPDERRLLGITGAPGSGKSTLADLVCSALAPDAVAVPMDGFHLASAELERLGRRDRKGAPDTFDAAGYAALLARLRKDGGTVYAPAFDRAIEEPVAGSIAVDPGVPLVVTEGNYLLLDEGDWPAARMLLDEVWYLDVEDDVRVERLVARHVRHGKTPSAARAWTLGSDARNASRIGATRSAADHVVRLTEDLTPGGRHLR